MLGLIVVAPEFVVVVLRRASGAAAIPLIQLLAWVGLLQSLQRLNSSVLLARDRTGTLLRYSVIVARRRASSPSSAGSTGAIVGVAAAYAIASTIVEPYYTWLTARVLDLRLIDFLRSLAGVAQATGAMAVIVLAARP